MTVVLDAGGVSALAGQRARLVELRRRGHWPAHVPAVVLTEALTGDHRRDFHVNRLLRACLIRDVDELPDPIVITSDPRDLNVLAAHTARPINVAMT